MVELVSFVGLTVISLLIARHKGGDFKDVKRRTVTVASGAFGAALLVVGNYVSALLIARALRPTSVPVGELTLLLCTRPSLFMLFCGLGFLLIVLEDKGSYHLSQLPGTVGQLRSDKIRQYLANVCGANAVTAAIMQNIGAAYYFPVVSAGSRKQFYYSGHLRPYWRGVPAQMMYAGALLWVIQYFFTIIFLIIFLYGMLEKIYDVAGERNRDRKLFRLLLNPLFRWINNRSVKKKAMTESGSDLTFGGRMKLQLFRILAVARPLYLRLYALLYELPREKTLVETPTEEEKAAHDDASRAHGEYLQSIGLEHLHLRALAKGFHGRDVKNLDSYFLMFFTFGVVSAWVPTYISQWLFWAGFVESMGPK